MGFENLDAYADAFKDYDVGAFCSLGTARGKPGAVSLISANKDDSHIAVIYVSFCTLFCEIIFLTKLIFVEFKNDVAHSLNYTIIILNITIV